MADQKESECHLRHHSHVLYVHGNIGFLRIICLAKLRRPGLFAFYPFGGAVHPLPHLDSPRQKESQKRSSAGKREGVGKIGAVGPTPIHVSNENGWKFLKSVRTTSPPGMGGGVNFNALGIHPRLLWITSMKTL